ncbi:MAG: hypothetical protein ACI3Y3_01790 [Candidatus Cryptobacteroides sp.]
MSRILLGVMGWTLDRGCSTIVATTMNGPPADGRGGRRRGQDTTKAP